MHPALRREIVEGRQRIAILGEAFGDLGLEAVEVIGEDGKPEMGKNDKPLMEPRLIKRGARAEAALTRRLDTLHREMERKLIQGEKVKRAQGQSAKNLLQSWIDVSKASKFPGTLELYVRAANAYVEINGDHPINEVSLSHIDRVVVALDERGLAPSTINITLKCYRTFFNWCRDRDHISKVPRIKLLTVPRKVPRVMEEEDVQRFMAHLEDRIAGARNSNHRLAYRHHQRAFMVLLYTGLRRGVICAMRWDQINLRTGIIKVQVRNRFTTKQKREHEVYIPGVLVSYLWEQRMGAPDEVFLLDDGMGGQAFPKPHALSVAFKRHMTRLGIDNNGIKPVHQYRALAATRLRKAGADLETIRGILGHSDLRITAGYFSDPTEAQKQAVEKMGALFGETLAKKLPSPGKPYN